MVGDSDGIVSGDTPSGSADEKARRSSGATRRSGAASARTGRLRRTRRIMVGRGWAGFVQFGVELVCTVRHIN
ncbi:uncharacterized protein IUM83_06577 [Phytophthora cinnamomi]|uniref:uncharacterized protein n=1 Tax=Phytophthora cinnamomi TaxID=4785 RepID=UPI00355A2447|nr:hypothetical protein IUM83_06577 [Phytophthora cinnamomi]